MKTKRVPIRVIKSVKEITEYIYAEGLYDLPIQFPTRSINRLINNLERVKRFVQKVKV